VDAVTPQLRGDLATAGVPVAAQDELVAAFRRCALDRAEQQDPPSCQSQPAAQAADGASLATTPGVRDALVRAGEAARREVFDRAAARTLWYAVGAFALAFLLSFALPHEYDRTNHNQPPSRLMPRTRHWPRSGRPGGRRSPARVSKPGSPNVFTLLLSSQVGSTLAVAGCCIQKVNRLIGSTTPALDAACGRRSSQTGMEWIWCCLPMAATVRALRTVARGSAQPFGG
jgi:hypothetical protein